MLIEFIYVFLYQNLNLNSSVKNGEAGTIYVFLYQNLNNKLTQLLILAGAIYVFLYQNLNITLKIKTINILE